jgi:DNA-binding transcriptional ArsR family regulator
VVCSDQGMAKDKFLMVSLEDEQATQLAEVLNNKTSRKIIDYLSEHEDATEAALAKTLDVPLSTIHYNMQKLVEAKLVEVEEFHYSKKGREVDHYKLANKYVIITPKPVKGIKTALKKILPVGLVVLGIGFVIEVVQRFGVASTSVVMEAVPRVAEGVADAALDLEVTAASPVQEAAQFVAQGGIKEPQIALWFVVGGLTALVLYWLYSSVKK